MTAPEFLAAPVAAPARRTTRSLVRIGQRWERRRDHRPVVIVQVHRADRLVEVADDRGNVWCVAFSELRRRFRLLDGCAS